MLVGSRGNNLDLRCYTVVDISIERFMDDSMNVKWEKRKLDSGRRRRRYHLHAILVDKKGEKEGSKERVIEHLASIEERFLETKEMGMRAFHRGLFWKVADRKLEDLKLERKVRKGIEAEILEVVPRPTDEWGLWAVICVPKYEK